MQTLSLDDLVTVTGGTQAQAQPDAAVGGAQGGDFLAGFQQFLSFLQSDGFQQLIGSLQGLLGQFAGGAQTAAPSTPSAAPEQVQA